MDIGNLLSGTKILEEVDSPVNGKLTVIKDVAWGVHVKGGGLTQSGGVAERVWKTTLSIVRRQKLIVGKCLILGLGGGSIAKLAKENWPDSKIIGVDVDPVIVGLGRKYMDLDKYGVKVVIQDASKFVRTSSKQPMANGFDIICVDMYVGQSVPEKFQTKEFIGKIKSSLANGGVAIFNRLYFGEKRALAAKFLAKLEKVFSSVESVYPEANVMFVCS